MRSLPATGADCPEHCCGADPGFGLQKERIIKVGTNRTIDNGNLCLLTPGIWSDQSYQGGRLEGLSNEVLLCPQHFGEQHPTDAENLKTATGSTTRAQGVVFSSVGETPGATRPTPLLDQSENTFLPKLFCPQDLRLVPGRSRWGSSALW